MNKEEARAILRGLRDYRDPSYTNFINVFSTSLVEEEWSDGPYWVIVISLNKSRKAVKQGSYEDFYMEWNLREVTIYSNGPYEYKADISDYKQVISATMQELGYYIKNKINTTVRAYDDLVCSIEMSAIDRERKDLSYKRSEEYTVGRLTSLFR